MSKFITQEQKVLLLFSEDSDIQKEFRKYSENLRKIADEGTDFKNYQSEKQKISSLVAKRVMKEWQDIKKLF